MAFVGGNPFSIAPEGRDGLSRNAEAIPLALGVGFAMTLIGVRLSLVHGVRSPYFGALVDWMVPWVVEMFSVIARILVGTTGNPGRLTTWNKLPPPCPTTQHVSRVAPP